MLAVLACFLVLSATVAVGQSVQDSRNELRRLRNSIEQTRARIDALGKRESKAMKSLSSYQRQRHQIASFIAQLEVDLRRLQDTAAVIEERISRTQDALRVAESEWRTTSTALFMYETGHAGIPPATLLNSVVYRNLATSLNTYRRTMLQLKDSLSGQRELLEDVTTTQSKVLATKEREQSSLATTIAKSKVELKNVRANKTALLAELARKEQSARRVRSLIDALVTKERTERQRTERDRQRNERGPTAPQRGGFRSNSLPWPTSSTAIAQGFGTYRNPQTGTTLENPGIDIKAAVGSRVSAVAAGTVSTVTWLPGYGSLVIVDHRNGFRTVYANLASVRVQQGGSVETGTMIGASGENVDGALVHFEVWYGREKHNPLTYLR